MKPASPRALVVLLVLTACGGEEVTAPSPYAELEAYLRDEMRTGDMPGVAASLIEDGEVKWIGTFGYADLPSKRPVTADTPFLVASISKTIVSYLAMQLAEQGKLSLDDAIDVPLGYAVAHPGPSDRPVTPRMLATHTSGLTDDWAVLGSATTSGDSSVPLQSFARDYLSVDHFARRPGSGWEYSNAGFGVFGAVVEAAAGEPLPEMSKRTVFGPLGMTSTGWHLADLDASKVATPYSGTWRDGFLPSEQQGFSFYPATSLRTTITDLSKFLISFIRFGAAPDGTRVLAEETARAMRELQVSTIDDDQGFVWYWDDIGGERWFGHTGSAVGASAMMFFRPSDGRGVIVLTNADVFIRSRLGFPEGSQAIYRMAARIGAGK